MELAVITFSNGHQLDFACASGALAFNGLGWPWEQPFRWAGLLRPNEMTVVAKTVTHLPRKGNLSLWRPWRAVSLIPHGAVNAVGLTNSGIKAWVEREYPVAKKHGLSIAASIQPEYPDAALQVRYMATKLYTLELAYIEVNISCPNVRHTDPIVYAKQVLESLSESAKQPLVVKVSYAQSQNVDFMRMIDGFDKVEAIHAINTIPWSVLYPNRTSPLKKYYGFEGGVSGQPIFEYTQQTVKHLSSFLKTPIIAGGGIGNIQHVSALQQAGASAFSIGTLFLRQPWKPNTIIRQWRKANSKNQDTTNPGTTTTGK